MSIQDYTTEVLEAEILRRKQNKIVTYIQTAFNPAFVRNYTINDGSHLELKALNDAGDVEMELDDETGPLTLFMVYRL